MNNEPTTIISPDDDLSFGTENMTGQHSVIDILPASDEDFVASVSNIPSTFKLDKRESVSNSSKEMSNNDTGLRTIQKSSVVSSPPGHQNGPPDLENDGLHKVAVDNITAVMEMSASVLQEYQHLLEGVDAPGAFSVWAQLIDSHTRLSKTLADVRRQEAAIKQASRQQITNHVDGQIIQNQTNNIQMNPVELIRLLKSQEADHSNNSKD